MNVRSSLPGPRRVVAGAAFFALFTALPALLVGLPRTAAAQPAGQADSVTQIARQRYNDGVKAYDAGRYEDARQAFLQAYALKRHPAVLLNLGQSELRSGHYDDAGNHLQQFLREYTTATPDEKTTAQHGVAEAKKKASFVVVSVDAAGADVSIDGTTIGKSPIYDPVFVKAGKHTIFATAGGRSAAVAIDAKVGVASTATLTLGTGAAPPPPVPAPPAPLPPTPPPSGPPPGLQPVTPPMGPPPGVQPPLGPTPLPPQEPESFFHWYKRKPIAWAGTGLAGAGLIMGIAGGAAALSATGAANDVSDQIRKVRDDPASQFYHPGMPSVCGNQDTGAGVYPGYEMACKTLSDNISLYHTDMAVAITGWVFFGLGVAGTAVYTFIDWYPNRNNPPPDAAPPPKVGVVPVVSPTFKGLSVLGTF